MVLGVHRRGNGSQGKRDKEVFLEEKMLELLGQSGVSASQFSRSWIVHRPSNLEFGLRVDITAEPFTFDSSRNS